MLCNITTKLKANRLCVVRKVKRLDTASDQQINMWAYRKGQRPAK